MNQLVPRALRRFMLLPGLFWVLACGFSDAPKPVKPDPLALPNVSVVQEDFAEEGPTWEIIDGTWSRRTDAAGESVFAQTAVDRDFPVAFRPVPIANDLDVEVRFRPLSGKVDASGGIVFRARDGQNYYLVRANSLENNFRLYRIEDGKRRQIASTRVEAPGLGEWHTLRVVAVGEQIQAYLNRELLIDHRDGAFASGRVGLWTKADAVTDFDDFIIRVPSVNVSLDPIAIGAAAGTPASQGPDGVVRIGWSRTDVVVRVDGAPLAPAAGLGSWAAFRATSSESAMVMGDTVVFQDEITPALDAALAGGLEVTALHNHFVFDDPPVYFMHIGGHGSPDALASAVKSVWDVVKRVRAGRPEPGVAFPGLPAIPGSLDAARIGEIVGHKATQQGGVVKVTIPRAGRAHGVIVGGSMGLTTWAAFSGSDPRASVDGDFIMTVEEVQPVIRALRAAGIHVVALHNHMLDDEPRFFFLHYWGKGAAAELAQGVRAALSSARVPPNGGIVSRSTAPAAW